MEERVFLKDIDKSILDERKKLIENKKKLLVNGVTLLQIKDLISHELESKKIIITLVEEKKKYIDQKFNKSETC